MSLMDSLLLDPVFANNVGWADTVVFGPSSFTPNSYQLTIPLSRPFRYKPAEGNLQVDIRIPDGTGPPPMFGSPPSLSAFNSTTDELSRVWSTNVTNTVASVIDTVGLGTAVGFSPVPSLRVEFEPHLCEGCASKLVRVSWPPQPTNFSLQWSPRPEMNSSWQPATNQVLGSPDPYRGGWFVLFQSNPAGPAGYFSLIWPNGY